MKRPKIIDLGSLNTSATYVEINGIGWRNPEHLSIHDIMNFMQLDIPREANVKLVTFSDQDVSIERPPETYLLEQPLNIAVDDNFMYVWVKNRWKRVPLSEF